MSKVRVTRYVACPFSATIEFAEKAVRRNPSLRVSPVESFGEQVVSAAKAVPDGSDQSQLHDALLIAWRPLHSFFPEFRGVLTIRPRGRGTSVRLQGSYDPPFGSLGKIFDLIFGRAIAHATMARLLAQLGKEIEAQWADFRADRRRILA